MKRKYEIAYYALATLSSIFFASGLLVLSGGEHNGSDGNVRIYSKRS